MDRFFSQQSSASAAVHLAQRLLVEAEACPALITRRDPAALGPESSEPFPPLALLSDPVLDVRPYLEHLVQLAAASARRSEALTEQARRRSRSAKWQMLAGGCLCAAALLVGVLGLVASRNSDARLAEIREHLMALTAAQQQAQNEIATLAARNSNTLATETAARGNDGQTTAVAIQPALQAPTIRYYTQPWPDSQPSPRTPTRKATGSRFLAGFRQNIQAVLQ